MASNPYNPPTAPVSHTHHHTVVVQQPVVVNQPVVRNVRCFIRTVDILLLLRFYHAIFKGVNVLSLIRFCVIGIIAMFVKVVSLQRWKIATIPDIT